jgi:hypothetical protein
LWGNRKNENAMRKALWERSVKDRAFGWEKVKGRTFYENTNAKRLVF